MRRNFVFGQSGPEILDFITKILFNGPKSTRWDQSRDHKIPPCLVSAERDSSREVAKVGVQRGVGSFVQAGFRVTVKEKGYDFFALR